LEASLPSLPLPWTNQFSPNLAEQVAEDTGHPPGAYL
jgi:hypothetical protein